tara:strand:- start:25599 stop:27953 length:2355 start_codon:yes stop_codon:yes gene_type:complete
MLFGSDTVSLGYMAREFYANAVKGGEFPFWNPVILGGTPFIESLAGGDSLYPPSAILLFLLDPHRALGWKLIWHVFFAGIFTYGWIRCLGLSKTSAFLAGLAYGLAPFMVSLIHGGQDGKIFVMSLTPLLFWATESFLLRPTLIKFATLSLVTGSIILTTHFQTAYFLFGAVGAYALFRTIQSWLQGRRGIRKNVWALSRFGAFLVAALLGGSVAAVQLIPATSYVLDHSRRTSTTTQADSQKAIDYSSSWSLHPEEILGLAIPEFVGVTTAESDWGQNTYWGRNFFKGNHEYVGLVVILLAGLSFFGGAQKHLRYFFSGLGVLVLLFCLGNHTPIWRMFYEFIPGISLFRAPSLAVFLFGFSTVTLMAFGVERMLDISKQNNEIQWIPLKRFLWTAVGTLTLGLISVSSGTFTDIWTSFFYKDITTQSIQILNTAEPYILRGFTIAVLLAIATSGIAWALIKKRLAPKVATILLAFLIIGDLVRIDTAFIRTTNFENFRSTDPNIDILLERQRTEDPFRVFSLHGLNGQDVRPGMFGLELAGGHHPNDLARYRDIIGMTGSSIPVNLIGNVNVLRILNVRYILWPDRIGTPEDQGLPTAITDNLELVSQTTIDGRPYESIYRFTDLPRARIVGEAVILSDDQSVPFILSEDFDPTRQVVLNDAPPIMLSGKPITGSVKWLERNNNNMSLHVNVDRPALLVLADNWFPAWKGRIGNDDVPVLRANHTLRAIPIPAGEHKVELYYESSQIVQSFYITILGLILVSLLLIVGWIKSLSSKKNKTYE